MKNFRLHLFCSRVSLDFLDRVSTLFPNFPSNKKWIAVSIRKILFMIGGLFVVGCTFIAMPVKKFYERSLFQKDKKENFPQAINDDRDSPLVV